MVELWRAALVQVRRLVEKIISQTERRVLGGEVVPASEKIVSLFEPHADIIVKCGCDTQYGHKLNLVTGRSGLFLDLWSRPATPSTPQDDPNPQPPSKPPLQYQ
jgi:transposase, IS5 family